MKFARRARTEVEVNLTALIDVVFLLLIFFMVSTTFTKETHLTIDLPEAAGTPTQVVKEQVDITINRAGEYAVNDTALLNTRMESLKNAVIDVSKGDNTLPLVITADAATPHQAVVTAMDVAGQLGFTHLSITTRNAKEE